MLFFCGELELGEEGVVSRGEVLGGAGEKGLLLVQGGEFGGEVRAGGG